MTAIQYAKGNGFTGVRKIAPWRGYVCYEALYDNAGDSVNNVPAIGLPQIILERNGKFRMAKPDETMGYMEEVKIDGDG
jgi:hypothetical protein